jgi:hypothetical protein
VRHQRERQAFKAYLVERAEEARWQAEESHLRLRI